ncbi:MAG: hypothetical protein ACRDO7_12130 [Nocardioidaceae bacterium]
MQAVKIHIEIARTMIMIVRGKAEKARREGRSELGASAVEWAIISAIVVTLALLIADVVRRVIEARSGEIDDGING